MLLRISTLFLTIVILFMGTGFFSVHAQEIITASDVTVKFTPEVPGPYQNVSAKLNSYVINLDTADITWFINNKEVLRGIGEKNFSFVTAGSGDVFDIQIDIVYGSVGHIVKRVRIQPADIDLLWQAMDSYVFPFYRGKALPASESILKVVAIPGNISTNNQYVYKWENSGEVDQQQSGFNKNSFLMKNSFFRNTFDVGVEATSRDGKYHVQSEISVPWVAPKIVFEVRTNDGNVQYGGGDQSVAIGPSGAQIIAHPLFFSTYNGYQNVNIKWIANKQPISADGVRPNQFFMAPLQDRGAPTTFDVSATHAQNLLQEISGHLNLIFG